MSFGLRSTWDLRTAAAETLVKVEYQLRSQCQAASSDELITLLDTFSSARSPGPEWTRSFDALVEHLWMWCDATVLADAEASYRARGGAWTAIANALSAEHGARVRDRLRHQTAPSRLPPFTLG